MIRRERYDSPAAQVLVEELQQDLALRYGGPDETPLAAGEFGAFLVAYDGERPVACAGIRANGSGTFELKRMYVRPEARGRGLARALLAELEDAARELGGRRIRLETGNAQPEAIALYASSGYTRIPGFGIYAEEPDNVCFGKELG